MLVLPGRVGDLPIRAMNSASTGPFFREISRRVLDKRMVIPATFGGFRVRGAKGLFGIF